MSMQRTRGLHGINGCFREGPLRDRRTRQSPRSEGIGSPEFPSRFCPRVGACLGPRDHPRPDQDAENHVMRKRLDNSSLIFKSGSQVGKGTREGYFAGDLCFWWEEHRKELGPCQIYDDWPLSSVRCYSINSGPAPAIGSPPIGIMRAFISNLSVHVATFFQIRIQTDAIAL